jgi:GNAT superfamily N-acetyltransferase
MSERDDPAAIREACVPDDMATVRELFVEYQDWLGVDLCFQGFEEELAGLPGSYARPGGNVWLAERAGGVIGTVALRPMAEAGDCEMKRLYLRPAARGAGVGRRLAEACLDYAAAAGYRRLCLDTLATMPEARGLYRALGFSEIPAYYHNPLGGTLYLACDLADWAAGRGVGS